MSYRSVFKPGLFEGQTVIVTGGGSGIGRCTAHEIAALGAHVVITGRKRREARHGEGRDRGRRAAPARRTPSTSARKRRSRKRSPRSWRRTAASTVCSTMPAASSLARRGASSAKGFDVVVRNNLTGGFIVSREVYTQSMEKHGGSIVNMTADYRNGFPSMVHTGAARAGMANLTMTLAYEWAVCGRAGELGGAGLDRLVRHGHLHGRVQGATSPSSRTTARSAGSAPRARSPPRCASC